MKINYLNRKVYAFALLLLSVLPFLQSCEPDDNALTGLEGRIASVNLADTLASDSSVFLYQPDTVTASAVVLTWSRSLRADFQEYQLYRDTVPGVNQSSSMLLHVTTNLTDTVFADTTVYGGTTYYYRVFVRDTAGISAGSNVVTVTTPGGNFVTNGDFELDLSGWELYTPDPCVTIAYDSTSPAGSKVLKAEMTTPAMANTSSEVLQTISQQDLIPGETYTLSFYGKLQQITGTGFLQVYLMRNDNFATVASVRFDNTASTYWNQYTVDFVAPATNAPYSLFVFAGPGVPWNSSSRFKVLLDGFSVSKR